jgi:tRNA (guanine-N7-)-methyltransferase
MRMRKKPNLVPRMQRCAATLITEPEALRGRWLEQFPGHRALQLELGCGKGRFTADTAAQNPDIFLAAIEKVPDAMVVGMERVTERGIENVRFLDRDAINLLDMFAPGEVSRIYINFPDPWKKSRQYKRRLTYAGFLALYANVLPLGGEIWFKTDDAGLFEDSLQYFPQAGFRIRTMTRDLHKEPALCYFETEHEKMFTEMGKPIHFLIAEPDPDVPAEALQEWMNTYERNG